MSPRDINSASSDDSFSEDFANPAGAFQAHKRLALEKYGFKDRFDLLGKNDDISEITTGQEKISDDSPAAAFRARKLIAQKKYVHNERSLWFDADELAETSSSESATTFQSASTVDSTSSAQKQRRRSSVRFSTVSVRSFDRTVGDHPCCHGGPALALDWEYQQQPAISVEKYETTRKPRKRRLFPCERHKILSCWSIEEVTKKQVESERKHTVLNTLAKLFCRKS